MRATARSLPDVSVAEAAYASAHFGKSLLWHGSQFLFAYFLTEACGFSPLAMGLTLTGALLVNAVCDLGVGRVLSRLSLSYPSLAKVQMGGAVLTVLAIQLFAGGARLPPDSQMMMVVVGLGLFAFAYSLIDVPQNAILGLAPFGTERRMRASATRLVLSGSAEIVIVTGFTMLMRGLPASAVGDGFFWLSAGTGTIAIAGAALLAVTAEGAAVPRQAAPSAGDLARPHGTASDIGTILMLIAIFMVGSKITGKMEPYIAAHWFAAARDGAVFMAAIAMGSIIGQPVWLARLRAQPPRRGLLEPAAVMALGGLAFPLSALGFPGAAVSGLLLGLGHGGISLHLWTRLAHQCNRSPEKATEMTGLFTFVSKSAAAMATLVMSQFLIDTGADDVPAHIWAGEQVMTWLPAFSAICLIIAEQHLGKVRSKRRAMPVR